MDCYKVAPKCNLFLIQSPIQVFSLIDRTQTAIRTRAFLLLFLLHALSHPWIAADHMEVSQYLGKSLIRTLCTSKYVLLVSSHFFIPAA